MNALFNKSANVIISLITTVALISSCFAAQPAASNTNKIFSAVEILPSDSQKDIIYKAAHVTPSQRQFNWQQYELTMFAHFGVNTFTNREWGTGTEDPALFNPTALDTDQWVKAAKDAGFKLIIATAKHHDGFCLWPSKYTKHSVKYSPWKNGKGDVLAELARSCKKFGLKFGVYLSPADLHEIKRSGGFYGNHSKPKPSVIPTPTSDSPNPKGPKFTFIVDDYNRYFLNQLYELLTEYGPIHEVWFDGANPKPGTGQTYNYTAWYTLIRKLAPQAVIAIKGPDVRWIGNEAGRGRPAEWSVIPVGSEKDLSSWPDRTARDLGSRQKLFNAKYLIWYPAEMDTSIRPGWFYHASQDSRVKSLKKLLDIYYSGPGNNSVLLLNIPPDRRGLLHENDVARLHEFAQVIKQTFSNNLAAGAEVSASNTKNNSPKFSPANIIDNDYETYWTTDDWTESASLTITLPEKRTFDVIMLQEYIKAGQRIEQFTIEAFLDGTYKQIAAAQTVGYKKLLRITPVATDRIRINITHSRFAPTLASFGLFKRPQIQSAAQKSAPFFDPSKSEWKVIYADSQQIPDELAKNAIDNNPDTIWHTQWKPSSPNCPHEIKIDLAKPRKLYGFSYLPRTNSLNGTVEEYEFYTSSDAKNWTLAAKGSFANIKNNPVLQEIYFKSPITARYIRFVALKEVNNNPWTSVAEIGIITSPPPKK